MIMQDFTGVPPCVVDLATMREAVTEMGGDPPAKVNPPSRPPSSSSTTR